jgi:deazaflavin-dependent oxidoreductase (nitroreductase family)
MDRAPQSNASPITRSRGLALVRRVAGPLWLRSVFPVEVDGITYLLSQYGASDWVRNLRAAGRGNVSRKGHAAAFTAVEVDGAERERVIAAFRAKTPRPFRGDFEQRPAAASHPAFRLEPIG